MPIANSLRIGLVCLAFAVSAAAHAQPPAPAQQPAAASEAASGKTESEKPGGPLSPTDRIVLRFMELDTDASEGVSFDEYMAMVNQRAEDRFRSMDANQDEEVSEEEFRQFWLTRKAQWYRLRR